eukprot:6205964-Pleurochrysis_carterae.AAC.5
MALVDVPGALVVLRTVRHVDGALVVYVERRRVRLRQPELAEMGTQKDNATLLCFLGDQEMAARPCMKTQPEVEWRVAQFGSECPCTPSGQSSYRRPI